MKEENYWKKYGKEIEVEDEVRELGLEKVENGEVEIPEKLAKEMGVEEYVTHETDFHKATGFSIAGVSLTDDQITFGRKQPIKKSLRWLVEWFIMELLKAKYIVKWIKGKFSRAKKNVVS
jgi:hypothetical protein